MQKPTDMARQLTFDLPSVENRTRGDYFVGPSNALAFETLETPDNWPGGKLILTGPAGSGKTHLAHVWAETQNAALVAASDLLHSDPGALAGRSVVVDDADRVAGQPALETALFHLHNLILAEGGRLLMTAATPPRDWGLALPDLISRLGATAIARLEPPDDALLSMVLLKLFNDRQLTIAPALLTFLTRRMGRSLAEAATLVDRLDKAALSENRAITRAFAAKILDQD